MAVEADAVVVDLVARTEEYQRKMAQAATATEAALGKVVSATGKEEKAVASSADRIAARRARLAKQIGLSNEEVAASLSRVERRSAQAQNATRNLGRQIGDIGTGLATGQNPFFVIAQQSAQVADALADTGGKAAKVATFFAGPWGAALLAAGSALGILLGEALKTGESVDDLVTKLKQNAAASEQSDQAARIFANSQAGLSSRIREATKALEEQNASLRTNAQLQNVRRQQDANAAGLAAANAANRVNSAQSRLDAITQQALRPGISDAEIKRSFAERDRLRGELKAAQEDKRQADINLNTSRVFLARERAQRDATPEGRARGRYEDLLNTASRDAVAAAQAGKQIGSTTLRVFTALERQANAAAELAGAESNRGRGRRRRGRKGPSAETLARRAETERVRGVRDDEAYQTQLADINRQLIAAARARVTDAGQLAEFSRQEVAEERNKRIAQIDADESAKRISAARAEELRILARGVAVQKMLNIKAEERARRQAEADARAGALLDVREQGLRNEQAATDDVKRRRDLELQIIDARYKHLIAIQEQIAADASLSDATRQLARIQIDKLKAEQAGAVYGANEAAKGSYQRYRESMVGAQSLADDIDRIKIDTLERASDSLAQAAKNALGLSGALGDVASQIIKIGIQRKLIGPIADALFGKSDGSTSGAIGGILQSVLGGREGGGNVRAGQPYIVGEKRAELFVPSQSGKIIPRIDGPGGGGRVVNVYQTHVFDARGGITTPQLIDQFNRVSTARAQEAGRAAYEASPQRSAKLQSYGN